MLMVCIVDRRTPLSVLKFMHQFHKNQMQPLYVQTELYADRIIENEIIYGIFMRIIASVNYKCSLVQVLLISGDLWSFFV